MREQKERAVRLGRRVVLGLVTTPFVVAIVLTVIDRLRRRGMKSTPFPRSTPETVDVPEGTVTVYTYGQDLYDAMLAAIDSAKHQVLFETYIWKADEVGDTFKRALSAAADRG